MRKPLCLGLVLVGMLLAGSPGLAEDTRFSLAEGKLELAAPGAWTQKRPAVSIIEHEFAIPAAKGDTADGRLTVMGAGGSVEANIDRWYAQFSLPDGGNPRDKAKVKKLEVAGQQVHLVDISGTFKDQRGPNAPAVERPNYRMLGAIIVTKGLGNYFLKFYGPDRTVADNEKAFLGMIESLKQK